MTLVGLGYSARFSIIFGAIAGLAGGMITGWWQFKGGASGDKPKGLNGIPIPKESQPANEDDSPGKRSDGRAFGNRLNLPFVKPRRARKRYQDRMQRARDRRREKRQSTSRL